MDISDFTVEDLALATREYWAFTPSGIRIVYNDKGYSPHAGQERLVEFIYRRAVNDKSRFHAEVYAQLPWTAYDDQIAMRQGWRLVHGKIYALEVPQPKLSSNEGAAKYVQANNNAGEPVCMKATVMIAKQRMLQSIEPNNGPFNSQFT